ncbi:hypothetical protein EI555_011344 [Monodon monoceros]|uniref:40S ribosomal protein S3a n=1 Tax=Monodon monoceros TaxID=40151 RepID=A0A4U1EL09_MONMO|nr:hypothetical protein EI555_011344 [Monodon monoceros]
MEVSKNKHLMNSSKKGTKKKVVDLFSKKDWYVVKAPAMFNIRNIGKTLNDEVALKKFKLITEDVQGKNCLISMAWIIPQTVTETHVDVKTTNGYLLVYSLLALLKKCNNQIQKTSYAQHQRIEIVNKLIPDSIGKDMRLTSLITHSMMSLLEK